MTLSKRAQELTAEYPQPISYWKHPVEKALVAGALSLSTRLSKKGDVIDFEKMEWREIENFLRDSNLITAWDASDVDGLNVAESFQHIRKWLPLYSDFSRWKDVQFTLQELSKDDFRYQIKRLRQIHDFLAALSKSSQFPMRISQLTPPELSILFPKSLDEEGKGHLLSFLENEFEARGLSEFKLIAE